VFSDHREETCQPVGMAEKRTKADIAQRDFAKRFERGKLSFTGDVLQVISVVGRQQKFAKLLKRSTVGA
jgi:hypothetical protein